MAFPPWQKQLIKHFVEDKQAVHAALKASLDADFGPFKAYINGLLDALYSATDDHGLSWANRERALVTLLTGTGATWAARIHYYFAVASRVELEEIPGLIVLAGAYTGVDHATTGLRDWQGQWAAQNGVPSKDWKLKQAGVLQLLAYQVVHGAGATMADALGILAESEPPAALMDMTQEQIDKMLAS